ncbi:hypothetical protein [Aliidiomarina quisquiliarum]|uniref:hypothetical protein n=1 Tax=Aliidiomarina quisquiliarum TaxID=2938947 RepID=UPI00208FBE77|nr:hypothetical protein [Aliidiomarina quisquiliarum]MCO4319919.1 hypothetical protein [Aliidiomarina quisquiliarum]
MNIKTSILLVGALLISVSSQANANRLQQIPENIDLSSASVSRSYLEAELGREFIADVLDRRHRHNINASTPFVEVCNRFQLSIGGEVLSQYSLSTNNPSSYEWAVPRHVIRIRQVGIHANRTPANGRCLRPSSVSMENIAHNRFNVKGMVFSVASQASGLPVPRGSTQLNALDMTNANMLFLSWLYDNQGQLVD